MTARSETLASTLTARFGERLKPLPVVKGDVAFEVAPNDLLAVCRELRDEPSLAFEQLVDCSGIDYLDYGREEWRTHHRIAAQSACDVVQRWLRSGAAGLPHVS